MSWVLTTSGAALFKAGANASSVVTSSGAMLAKFSDMSEGVLNTITRYDWTTNYSLITTNFKPILDDVCSDMIAMRIINYDMSNFTSREEAQTMLDVLRDNISRSLEVLRLSENQEVMR